MRIANSSRPTVNSRIGQRLRCLGELQIDGAPTGGGSSNIVELFGKFGMGVGGKKGEEIATLIATLETDIHGAVNASSLTGYKRSILAAAKKIAGKDGQTLADKLFTLYDLVKGNLTDEQKWSLLKTNILDLANYLAGTDVLKIPQVRAAMLGFELGRPFGEAIARDLKLIAEKKLAEGCLTAIAKKQESDGIPTLGNLANVDFGTATEATIQRGIFKHDWFCRVLPNSVADGVKGAVLEVERAPSVFEVKGFRWEWGNEKFYFDTFFSGVQTNK